MLQHWAVDTRISARAALPIDVLQPQTVDPTSGATIQLPPHLVLNQPLYLTGSQYRGGRAINDAAFSTYTGTTGDGSAGRNLARGFNAVQTNLTLRRNFRSTSRWGCSSGLSLITCSTMRSVGRFITT